MSSTDGLALGSGLPFLSAGKREPMEYATYPRTRADTLTTWLAERNQPAYRARQVRGALFERRVGDFAEMTELPKDLRSQLAADFQIWTTTIAKHHQAADGTEKLLLELHDGQRIECVLLRDGPRRTICISSQVGCAMGCVFCASGLDGVARNLTAGEIVEQMLRLAQLLPKEERLSHIVVMGMGEPLANLNHLLAALAEATDPHGPRHQPSPDHDFDRRPAAGHRSAGGIGRTVSIGRLAPCADDELRSRLVPVNKNIGLAAILAAADHYFEVSGRRLTFEYVLLGGVNDETRHARKLAELLGGRSALLNVIPYNAVAGLPYRSPNRNAQERFLEILRDAGLNVQVRQRKGDAIDAACGQLRRISVSSDPASSARGAAKRS